MCLRRASCLIVLATSPLVAQTQPQAPQQPNPNRPTLFLVGDLPTSIQGTFDPNSLRLVGSPANGQTTRTYINSGRWDKLLAEVKPGDFIMIGFKPNTDTTPAKLGTDTRAAASLTLESAGDGTYDYMDPDTHELEHIHSYGWYLRKLVVDSISHGARPILCYPPTPVDTPFPNNPYLAHPAWIIKAITVEQHVPYLDLTTQAIRPALQSLQPDPLEPYLKPAAQ